MIQVTRTEVKTKVKVLLDELTPNTGTTTLAGDALTQPVAEYIDKALDEATDSVRMVAPVARLNKKALPVGGLWQKSLGADSTLKYYLLPAPDDFLKIAYIHMFKWKRGVEKQTPPDGEEYKLLQNPMTTAGPSKPAVVYRNGSLELYGSREDGDSITENMYIHKQYFYDPTPPAPGLTIDKLALDAICWRCAVQVLAIMGRAEVLKKAEEFYQAAVIAVSG